MAHKCKVCYLMCTQIHKVHVPEGILSTKNNALRHARTTKLTVTMHGLGYKRGSVPTFGTLLFQTVEGIAQKEWRQHLHAEHAHYCQFYDTHIQPFIAKFTQKHIKYLC